MLWKIRNLLPAIVMFIIGAGLQIIDLKIPWLGYALMGLGGLLAIYYTCTLIKEKQPAKAGQNEKQQTVHTSEKKLSNIIQIKGQEPSNQPPTIFHTIIIICAVLTLAFSGWVISTWISEKTMPLTGWQLLLSLLLFIVGPIWAIVDTLKYLGRRKQHESGESSVAKNKTITLYGDIDKVFDECLGVLEKMQATTIRMEKTKLFRGHLRSLRGDSIITVRTNRVKGKRVKIYVQSDAQWRTVKWDIFNVNQKNIDTFERLIRSEFGY